MSQDPNAPVIVAVAQQTWREPDPLRTPLEALQSVAESALQDSACAGLAQAIDAFATVRFITDTSPDLVPLFPRNPGLLLARQLGIENASFFQTDVGGNTPQFLVNHFAGLLAAGEVNAVLISGAELLNTFFTALRSGGDISSWKGEETELPVMIGTEKEPVSPTEKTHGFYDPINTYPLFENALRHHLGTAPEEHHALIAKLCSNMSAIAADNPYAWKPAKIGAGEIGTVTDKNRYVGYPYTKAMNAILSVDMAAAIVMTTAGRAQELGIAPEKTIYLRAGADVNDIWNVSERETLYQAPAIGLAASTVLEQAGLGLDAIDCFDIYSCFPSAVEIACNEIGLYSTEPGPGAWQAVDAAALQRVIDAGPRVPVATDPTGPVTVESYTVAYGRSGPSRGIIIGRNAAGERILANTTAEDTIQRLLARDPIGSQGKISREAEINLFEFQSIH
jgi:acetyl-CoA C-acetyltransferase